MRASSPRGNPAAAGFTIVELMTTVAIISILTVIALPAYMDYATRSKVSEGMTFAAEARTSISERYYTMGAFPTDNASAGLITSVAYDSKEYIRRLTVGSDPRAGTITVTFKLPNTVSDNKKLLLVPSTRTEVVTWTCLRADPPDGIKNSHAPPNCR
ncbi:MAG: pilin [Halioglobus sp.]